MHYEEYTEPVSAETKAHLRQDELAVLGYLPDNSKNYSDEESLKEAFKQNLEI